MKDDIDILISKVCDENGFEYEIPEESVLIVFLNSQDRKSTRLNSSH